MRPAIPENASRRCLARPAGAAGRGVPDDGAAGQGRIEPSTAQHRRGNGPGRFGAIHHQQHRAADERGQLGCAVAARGIHPVEQTAIALDDGDVRIASGRGKRRLDGLPGLRSVEVESD